jgi:hypothetical protein
MEFASFMAGEPWSDHPTCTHPLLASLAREVNDRLSHDGRTRIVALIPDVIGVVGDDRIIDVTIAVHAAVAALPVAAFERQKSLAVALLRCERELAAFPKDSRRHLSSQIRAALADTPDAALWAESFTARSWGKFQDFSRTAHHIVHLAVSGIAEACVRDVDDRLIAVLADGVHDVRQLVGADGAPGEDDPPPLPDPGACEVSTSAPLALSAETAG